MVRDCEWLIDSTQYLKHNLEIVNVDVTCAAVDADSCLVVKQSVELKIQNSRVTGSAGAGFIKLGRGAVLEMIDVNVSSVGGSLQSKAKRLVLNREESMYF